MNKKKNSVYLQYIQIQIILIPTMVTNECSYPSWWLSWDINLVQLSVQVCGVSWRSVVCGYRLSGDCWGVPVSGDRWTGPAAAEGGPSHGNHEHQAGPRTQDLCPDQHAQRLVAHLALHTNTNTLPSEGSSAMTGQTRCAQDLPRVDVRVSWVQVLGQNCLMDVLSWPAEHEDISWDCLTHLLHW